jgi:UPF0758 protein amet_2289
MSIKKLPTSERPYEKMQMYGAESLSNSELLAVIIKTGTNQKTSVELAQEILTIKKEENSLQFLQDISIEEFMQIKGIGVVKAIQLKAVCELAKRMSRPINKMDIRIKDTKDVFRLLGDELRFERREKVKLLILNIKNILLKIVDVSYGGTHNAILETKDVFAEPIKMGAPRIILVHNHPSGDPTPSVEDVMLTRDMYRAGLLLGIVLIDHVVIGYNKCKSIFADRRDMIIG